MRGLVTGDTMRYGAGFRGGEKRDLGGGSLPHSFYSPAFYGRQQRVHARRTTARGQNTIAGAGFRGGVMRDLGGEACPVLVAVQRSTAASGAFARGERRQGGRT
jgi:hypothetical protein